MGTSRGGLTRVNQGAAHVGRQILPKAEGQHRVTGGWMTERGDSRGARESKNELGEASDETLMTMRASKAERQTPTESIHAQQRQSQRESGTQDKERERERGGGITRPEENTPETRIGGTLSTRQAIKPSQVVHNRRACSVPAGCRLRLGPSRTPRLRGRR